MSANLLTIVSRNSLRRACTILPLASLVCALGTGCAAGAEPDMAQDTVDEVSVEDVAASAGDPVMASSDEPQSIDIALDQLSPMAAVATKPGVNCDWPSIRFGKGVPVGGSAHLKVWSDGRYEFGGHLHDSGATTYKTVVGFILKSSAGRAYSFVHKGKVHGTFSSGSRNDNWNDTGVNKDIATHWKEFSKYTWKSSASTKLNADELLEDLQTAAAVAGTVISVVGAL